MAPNPIIVDYSKRLGQRHIEVGPYEDTGRKRDFYKLRKEISKETNPKTP